MSASTSCEPIAIGVGLDTARYGHYATFLREDRQAAAEPVEFLECRNGYQQLEETLRKLAAQHRKVHFHIRVDAASQYATNLLAFLKPHAVVMPVVPRFRYSYRDTEGAHRLLIHEESGSRTPRRRLHVVLGGESPSRHT